MTCLAGNDTINQAREFFDYTNFDGAILTKVDADAKGGSAISIAHITSRPVIYIGVGQGYDDIVPFDSNKFIESLFESPGQVGISVEDITSVQKISELAVKKVKSVEVQTTREEEKDILLLSKPPVKSLKLYRPAFPFRKSKKSGQLIQNLLYRSQSRTRLRSSQRKRRAGLDFLARERSSQGRQQGRGG